MLKNIQTNYFSINNPAFLGKKRSYKQCDTLTVANSSQECFINKGKKMKDKYTQVNPNFNSAETAAKYRKFATFYPFEIARIYYKLSDYLDGKTLTIDFAEEINESMQTIVYKVAQNKSADNFEKQYSKQIQSTASLYNASKKYLNDELSIYEFNELLETLEY